VAEQQGPAPSDDAAAAASSGNRAAKWSTFFRVAEIRARSTPQLVAAGGTLVALAVTFPWMTITRIRQGGAVDWSSVALLLIVDLTVLICLPGLCVAIAELVRRAWNLVTLDDGPLLPRLARAAAGFTVAGRRDMRRWLDGQNGVIALSFLVTPVLVAAGGGLVTAEAILAGRAAGSWVLGLVASLVALWVLPVTIPATVASLTGRISRRRPE
jgi:hypothetical protein